MEGRHRGNLGNPEIQPLKKIGTLPIFLVLVLTVFTMLRNSVWKDEITLLEDSRKKSPAKLRPLFNLARVYQKTGELDRAERLYLEAAHLFPENPDIYNNLGNIYLAKGEIDKAIAFYKAGLSYHETTYLYFNLARAFEIKGDLKKAINYYNEVLRLDPYDEEVRSKLIELSRR